MTELAVLGGEPLISYKKPHANRLEFREEDRQAVLQFMDEENINSYYYNEGWLDKFTNEVSNYFNKKFCVFTNSGTNALHSAFFALGLEPGDEVLVQTNTFFATVTPLFQLGLVPILVDSETDTGNISIEDLENKITSRTKAIVITHLWGHPADIKKISDIAKQNKIYLIEDISISLGATVEGQLVGTFSDIACFSLGSTKTISGGQGGCAITDNIEFYQRMILLGHFGGHAHQKVLNPFYRQFADIGYGHNYRMHVLALAIARKRFSLIDKYISMRHERFNLLNELLKETKGISIPKNSGDIFRGIWHGYLLEYDEKEIGVSLDSFVKALQAEGMDVIKGIPYPLLHQTKFFQKQNDGYYRVKDNVNCKRLYSNGDFPNAETFVKKHIFFPLFLDEPLELIEQYALAVKKVCENIDKLK